MIPVQCYNCPYLEDCLAYGGSSCPYDYDLDPYNFDSRESNWPSDEHFI